MTHRLDYDVLVIGARCAGAATAMLLARHGARVVAIDKAAYGTDALSTHALMRGGVWQLARWGLLDRVIASGAPAIRRTTFHYGADAIAVDIAPSAGVPALFAPRRQVLDRLLVDAAREAGAEVRFGARLDGLLRDRDGRVTGAVVREGGRRRSIAAGLVIGADGLDSTVAREVGAAAIRSSRHATASVYGYVAGLADSGYHWYFERGAGAGVIPTHGGHCVFATVPPAALRRAGRDVAGLFDATLAACSPDLARAVARGERVEALRRFAGRGGFLRRARGPGWALVGDAGYFKDPFTAHGITDALRDAELLADAVAAGTGEAMAAYQLQRDTMSIDFFDITQRIASFDWTFDELKRLHRALSAAMRAELDAMAARETRRAA